jgi:hypothetical protein
LKWKKIGNPTILTINLTKDFTIIMVLFRIQTRKVPLPKFMQSPIMTKLEDIRFHYREVLAMVPGLSAFASRGSIEGYVMYSSSAFALDAYANVPLFSRVYSFGCTLEELKERISSLREKLNNSAVIINEGIAEIKHGVWLYQVNPLESVSSVKVVLVIQAIPNG